MAFGRLSKVITTLQVQSVLFDFAKLSPTGVPIPQGTILFQGMKLPTGLVIAVEKQSITTVTTTNAAATIVFNFGGVPFSNITNLNYAGNQYLVLALDCPPGELTVSVGGGVGDITAGKFIYSFLYQQQKVS